MEEGIGKQTRDDCEKDSVQLSLVPGIAGLKEGGRAPGAKEYRWPLEAGRGKEIYFPLELPERKAVLSKL